MSLKIAISRSQALFFAVTGVAEGILTVLILASGRILEPGDTATVGLALRVGVVAGVPEAVVFFAAEYSRQKGDLGRMERELNLGEHGRLAASRLGRQALWESTTAASISSLCAFAGAVAPLMLASLLPGSGWLSIAVAISCLAIFGCAIGHVVSGCKRCWSAVLALAGVVLALLGIWLKVV